MINDDCSFYWRSPPQRADLAIGKKDYTNNK